MRFLVFCLVLFVLQQPVVKAQESSNNTSNKISSERHNTAEQEIERFEAFEALARSGKEDEYLTSAAHFLDHPLWPYAQAEYLKSTLSISKKTVINDFLTQYEDAPFSQKLRAKWLNYLVANRFESAFIEAYHPKASTRLDCHYYQALMSRGTSVQQLDNEIYQTWLSAKSLPRSCNKVLASWQKAQLLTPERQLERIKMAVSAKQFRLARYLKKSLPESKRYLVELWIKVKSKPNRIGSKGFWLHYDEAEFDIAKYAMSKWVFTNPESAYKWWRVHGKPAFSTMNPLALASVEKDIAIGLAVAQSPVALSLLNKIPDDLIDESVKQWRIAAAIQTGNWQLLMDTLVALPEHLQVDPAVVFWRARADVELNNASWSKTILHELAERRDYYGFLAANYLNVPHDVRHEPLVVDINQATDLTENKTYQRAMTLFRYNRFLEARKEWNLLVSERPVQELETLAYLAAESGWHDRPIFTLSQVGYLNDINLRFPLAYQSTFEQAAEQTSMPVSLLYAVARRESSFITDAYSNAGAAGLMQLKPSTASYVAKRRVSRNQLFQPQKNIELGARYLSRLFNKTDDNPVLSLAAYNAGIHKVERWLPKQPMAADAWVETIPYKETRNYIKAIYAYELVYQTRLGEKVSTLADLTELQVEPEI